MKDRAFNLDSKNINQGIGVRQTFIFEINIQEFFCWKIWPFFQLVMRLFWDLLRMGMCIFVYHDLRTDKEDIHGK